MLCVVIVAEYGSGNQGQKQVIEHINRIAKHDWAFVHVPKTAGASIRQACSGLNFHIVKHNYYHSEYESLAAFKLRRPHTKCFAFVRNPWDRLVSSYHFLKDGGISESDRQDAARVLAHHESFEAFVKEGLADNETLKQIHFRPQHLWLCCKDQILVDWLGKFENLNTEFSRFLICQGLERIELTSRNASHHSHYSNYYTPDTLNIVGDIYRKDIEMFNYDF